MNKIFVLAFLTLVACGAPSNVGLTAPAETDTETAELGQKLGTWKQVGKASYGGQAHKGPARYLYKKKANLSTRDQLLLTKKEDAQGRVFQLSKLSEAVLAALPDDAPPSEALDPDAPPEGTEMTIYPLSWNKLDCNSDGDDDTFLWDGDDRVLVSSPSAPRQRTLVRITSSAGQCTGTVLRTGWVLTASHCTFTSSGASASGYSVRNWAGESVGVSSVFRGPGYTAGSFDPDDDYTLLELNGSFSSATGDMDVSNISDSNINLVDDRFHNLGFPGNLNACSTVNSTLVHTANNQITGKNSRNVRWKGDGSGGHSGGPLYYCPSDDITFCDSDDKGFVVATVTGFSGWYNRHIGPRGAYFKDWATTIMDNN